MANCRHKVMYNGYAGCISKKMVSKPHTASDNKTKCGSCSGPYSDDEAAKKKCPMHEKFSD